ncbi:MAG TPA: hypothetical protein VKQ11_12800 [Candidatus Sulfotelmatobacter sp.]|nr:hypothetical protein [Candidatus Sulfotelmatobacter sp.]
MRAKTAAEPQATDWKKPAKSWAKSMIGLWGQREAEATLLKTNGVRLPADIQIAKLDSRRLAFGFRHPAFGVRHPASGVRLPEEGSQASVSAK